MKTKKSFHGYTLKKPSLLPLNELEYLEAKDVPQNFKIEFIDEENNLMVFADFWVAVYTETDGDDVTIPRTTEIKSTSIFDLSFDICDGNGDVVKDENCLFYGELFTFIKKIYEI